MADHYVICEPCVGVKDKACQEICPVDCIVESSGGEFPEMLFIHPEECICCSVCEPECPVNAIYQAEDVPEEWAQFVQLAADFFKAR